MQGMEITNSWLPTIKNINALPKRLRDYLQGIETICDPAGLIRENTILRELVNNLEKELIEIKKIHT